jgi:hypothetical protein
VKSSSSRKQHSHHNHNHNHNHHHEHDATGNKPTRKSKKSKSEPVLQSLVGGTAQRSAHPLSKLLPASALRAGKGTLKSGDAVSADVPQIVAALAQTDAQMNNGIHWLCREARSDLLKDVLARDAPLCAKLAAARNASGHTALHACLYELHGLHLKRDEPELFVAFDQAAAQCIDALLSNAAVAAQLDGNRACKERGETAILVAAKVGALSCMQMLCKHKLDVNKADRDGNEPIYHAWRRKFFKVCHVLVTSKADVRQMYVPRDVKRILDESEEQRRRQHDRRHRPRRDSDGDGDDDPDVLTTKKKKQSKTGDDADGADAAADAADAAPLVVDSFGFYQEHQAPSPTEANTAARQIKWAEMLAYHTKHGKWPSKFQSRLLKGVPAACRGRVWALVLGGESTAATAKQYKQLCAVPMPEWGEQIDVDVMRESCTHEMYADRYGAGQRALFRLIWATTADDKDGLGYCQGMSGIAAMLLFWLEEDTAFVCFQRLLRARHMRWAFWRGFPLLTQLQFFHDAIAAQPDGAPRLRAQLDRSGIIPAVYTTEWFLKCFYQRLPYAVVLHVWDLFVVHGYEVILAAALATMQFFEATHATKPIEDIMQAFQNAANADSPVTYAAYVPLLERALATVRKAVPRLRRQWAAEHGKSDKAEDQCIFTDV